MVQIHPSLFSFSSRFCGGPSLGEGPELRLVAPHDEVDVPGEAGLALDEERVLPGEAAGAQVLPVDPDGLYQGLQGDVVEARRRDGLLHLVHGPGARDELGPGGHIDPEVTGGDDLGRPDPDMDLRGPALLHELHDVPGGGPPHNAIVHEDDLLPVDVPDDGVELEPHRELPLLLGWLDEGPRGVPVLHEGLEIRDPRVVGEPDGHRCPGIGDRGDEIRLHRGLVVEGGADLPPHVVDEPALDDRVCPGEVDVLEDAVGPVVGDRDLHRLETLPGNPEELPRLDVPDEGSAQGVDGDALRGNDEPVSGGPDAEGLDPHRVPEGVEDAVEHEDDRVRAPEDVEAVDDGLLDLPRLPELVDDGRGDDLGVGGRGEDLAVLLELAPELGGVHQVPVVGDGEVVVAEPEVKGLGVLGEVRAGRGVPDMADPDLARELGEDSVVEDLGDEAHALVLVEAGAVPGRDACALLAPVLEGKKSKIEGTGYAAGIDDANDPAHAPSNGWGSSASCSSSDIPGSGPTARTRRMSRSCAGHVMRCVRTACRRCVPCAVSSLSRAFPLTFDEPLSLTPRSARYRSHCPLSR